MAYQDHQVQWEEGDQEDPKDEVGDVVSLELQVKMVQQVPQGPKENRLRFILLVVNFRIKKSGSEDWSVNDCK